MRTALTLAACIAAVATHAQTDPLQTPACRAALQQLQAAESASAPAALRRARSAAALACLQARGDAPLPPQRSAQPPLSVNTAPPLSAAAPSRASPAPMLPTRPTLPQAPRAEPLRSITSCDAQGCWASDGTRLQRSGGQLLGPRGFCTTVGAVLTCP